MLSIDLVGGTRPNFVKIAAVIEAFRALPEDKKAKLKIRLVHTGQHYDWNLSDSFLEHLNIGKPDILLKPSRASEFSIFGDIIKEYHKILLSSDTNLVIVVGDVNSTLAAGFAAKRAGIKLAHIEGGIRSFDMSMPEEINRVMVDSISDYYFVTSNFAVKNLLSEGRLRKNIFLVGNTMIDTLLRHKKNFKPSQELLKKINGIDNFLLLTLHRPANVDSQDKLIEILETIHANNDLKIIFPIHPRTKKVLGTNAKKFKNIIFTSPLPYFEFCYLIDASKYVITDSGGLSEECTMLNVPCITLRSNTERPETVLSGINYLAGNTSSGIKRGLRELARGKLSLVKRPQYWDGKTGSRILNTAIKLYEEGKI